MSTSVNSDCYTARMKIDLCCSIQLAINPCGAVFGIQAFKHSTLSQCIDSKQLKS